MSSSHTCAPESPSAVPIRNPARKPTYTPPPPLGLVVPMVNGTGRSLPTAAPPPPHPVVLYQELPFMETLRSHESAFATDGSGRLFARSETGTLTLAIDRSALGARYSNLTVAGASKGLLIFAVNLADRCIDRFLKPQEGPVVYLDSFTARDLPEDWRPFDILHRFGEIFVTFGPETDDNEYTEPGAGWVGVFGGSGNVRRTIRTRSVLCAPTALALVPGRFGAFARHLVVANCGDDTLNAFDPDNGTFAGRLRGADGLPLRLHAVRTLRFSQDGETLYAVTGRGLEADSVVYALTVRSD